MVKYIFVELQNETIILSALITSEMYLRNPLGSL